jgi:hypothetical protein
MWQNPYSNAYNPMAGFQAPPKPLGQMVVDAFENFKKSIVGHEEDGDNMVLTVKIPTNILKQDHNFSFLFK